MLKRFMNLAAAAALFAAATPGAAQVQTVDPNQPDAWQTAPAPESEETAPAEADEWTPAEQSPVPPVTAPVPEPDQSMAAQAETRTATTERANTVARDDVFSAAEGVFGRGAQGLAHILENILRDQGEPVAYIAGSEAGGAFIFGVRYGSGIMHHQIEGDRTVYWTGPSLGFDAGADANKVFVLVYNLNDSQDLFRRYPHAEGHAYFIGGFNAQYMRRGDIVLIPIRLGVGVRLGVNAGYMRFSERNRWLPF
jgi:hypothetical protein